MIRPQRLCGGWVAGAATLLLAVAACDPATEPGPPSEAARQATESVAAEHAHDSGEPGPGAAIAPERAVVAETLAYAEVDERLVYGHFVFPSDMVDPLPAVIVVHEWWGLNDGVRAMADRLAAEGYIVLAVDLFGGRVAEDPEAARKLMMESLENPKAAHENIRQAYRFVSETAGAPRVAALGWCFGGTWALNAALLFPEELDAAVIYYGQVTSDPDALAGLRVPILGHFAANDRSIPLPTVETFRQALDAAGVVHDIRIYPNVGHAFANPSGRSYDADAAAQAWELSLAFLAQHLAVPAMAN
ncbi:MAG TPA: dienelactone hydrolase family protein [Woeseiaceae bacterium]|nr:dienelactone hydrolase family protein [Woeseiaceae bacterium]